MSNLSTNQLVRASQHATRQSRGAPILSNTLNALPLVKEVMCATRSEPLFGRTVFVVGAGPSLSKQLPLMDEAGEKGVIFSVNTALPALKRADLLFTAEQIPLVGHVDMSKVDAACVDLMASREMWSHVKSSGKPVYWCTCPNTPIADTCFLGWKAPQLWYHYAATMGAVALAMEWGAARVVLIGCDLAYDTESGKSYADESAWGGETAKVRMHETEETMMMEVGVIEERVKRAKDLGVKPPMAYQPSAELPAWGGEGTVWTVSDLACQWEELSGNLANRAKALGIQAINATEGGAHIPGWEDVALEDVLASLSCDGAVEWSGETVSQEEYEEGMYYVGKLEHRCRPVPVTAAMEWKQNRGAASAMPRVKVKV